MNFALFMLFLSGAWITTLGNDSQLWIEGGSLRFEKNSAIQMKKELLAVEIKRTTNKNILCNLSVDYTFANLTPKAQTIKIGFPMSPCNAIWETESCPKKPSESSLTIDGKPFEGAQWTTSFIYKNEILQDLSYQEYSPAIQEVLSSFTTKNIHQGISVLIGKEKQKKISDQQELKVLELCHLLDKKTKTTNCEALPNLELQRVFVWQTTFEANKTVQVSHRFPDVCGFGNPENSLRPQDHCLNEPPIDGLWKKIRNSSTSCSPVFFRYVLKTGANWASTIEDFELKIKRERPEDLISTCFQGVKKINASEFSASRTNFEPKEDFSMVIIPSECRK